MAFKDRLKEARLRKGYTQEQVAEKIGVAKSTFTGYEKGNREPNMFTVSKILDALEIDANFLWQDEMGSNYPMKVSYPEYQHIEKYRDLDTHGKEMVDIVLDKELERCTAEKESNIIPLVKETNEYTLNAAHERTDIEIPEGADTSEDDIMDDDNF